MVWQDEPLTEADKDDVASDLEYDAEGRFKHRSGSSIDQELFGMGWGKRT
jgi:hypothetical protein